MATLEKAIQISAKAHEGQLDKAGQPYIIHPIKVMLRLQNEDERIAAILHDVIEDTEITLNDLMAAGFSSEVIDAVEALTKREGETRMEAAKRASHNPIALRVKLADNAENMDISRIANPTEKDFVRLEEYKIIRAFLLSEITSLEKI